MAYQFVHIQTYAPKLTKVARTKDQFNSTDQVFSEAERDPQYSEHVPNPEKPIPLMAFGSISVPELRKFHDERRAAIRETVTSADGRSYRRRLKSDFPTLYTEIHSHPMPAKAYRKAPREEQARVKAWAKIALKDFTNRMPEGVKFAAVLHLDEGNVHFHILAVNADDPKLSASKLHVGKMAADDWRQKNGSPETLASLPRPDLAERPKKPRKPKPSKNRTTQKKRDAQHAAALAAWEDHCARNDAENARALAQWEKENGAHLRTLRKGRKQKPADVDAYQSAMARFQDRYYEAVGKRCGLLRHGPRAERLATKPYAARKARARQIADEDATLRLKAQELAQKERIQQEREQAQMRALEELKSREERLQSEKTAIAAADQAAAAREAAMAAREVSIENREREQARADKALKEREAAQKQAEAHLRADRRDFQQKCIGWDQAARAKGIELQQREQAVKNSEHEISEACEALGDLVGQLEQGGITVQDGKMHFGKIPAFLLRMIGAAPETKTPVQKLVLRFVGILKRAVTAIGGGPDMQADDPEERLGM